MIAFINTDKDIIENPSLWKFYPILPLFKDEDVGVLVNCVDKRYTVNLVNVFAVFDCPTLLKTCEKIEYSSAQEILDDGWKVDD